MTLCHLENVSVFHVDPYKMMPLFRHVIFGIILYPCVMFTLPPYLMMPMCPNIIKRLYPYGMLTLYIFLTRHSQNCQKAIPKISSISPSSSPKTTKDHQEPRTKDHQEPRTNKTSTTTNHHQEHIGT